MSRKALFIGLIILAVAVGAAFLAPVAMGQMRDRARVAQAFPFEWPFEGGSRIGASVRDVQGDDVSREKLSDRAGAVVERLDTDSPAARAGLKAGDVVVEFDGERVRSSLHLTRLVRETPPGRTVPVIVVREGARTTIDLTPESSRAFGRDDRVWHEPMRELEDWGRNFDVESLMGWGGARSRLGVDVQPLTSQLAAYFGVNNGLLVASVAESSPAAKAGFKAGDVIVSIDGTTVTTRGDLVRALRMADDAAETSIEYSRQGQLSTAKVTLAPRDERRRAGRPRGV
jgi:serine protease Do